MESPMDATITSVEPRAFMAQPSATPSRQLSRPSMAPANAPENFPTDAISTSSAVRPNRFTSLRMVRSAARPDRPKKIGMKKAVIMPRSWP